MNGRYISRAYPPDVNVRRTGQGKEFPVGFIRGGGGGGHLTVSQFNRFMLIVH